MNFTPTPKDKSKQEVLVWGFIAFLIAVLVAAGFIYFVVRGTSRLEFNQRHEQFAALYARQIAEVFISVDVQTAQRLIDKITTENVRDIKIIEGSNFSAHSNKALVGQRVPKNLFDKTKDVGRTGAAVTSWTEPETINVALPLIKNGGFVGIVDLNYITPKFFPPIFELAVFLIAVLFLVLYFIVLRNFEKISSVAGFGMLFTMLLILYQIARPAISDIIFLQNSFIFTFILAALFFGAIKFKIVNFIWQIFFHNRLAYSYVAPATIGMLVLVFFPIFFGLVLGFTDYSLLKFKEPFWTLFIGFKNFIDILSDFNVFSYQNFYYTLIITIIWTASNVFLHVGIGLLLALILNSPLVAARRIYRTLLILPWAVPNYITALIWKGMFQREFGAINGLLNFLGLQSISWFEKPFTAFLTNLMTNVWLGFPFMMVIALGALQSIPADLYEAADIDGATGWQKFRRITLPLLRPSMTPAIIIGVVWTFNMFNIIYLVSGGAPYGATDILITSAYRWAFEKYQYGYAAAYSTIIFIILMGYSLLNIRLTRATESAYEKQ